ncbi:MAG: hypothetical protein ABI402_21005, partial [Ferruginibacter sp.]
MDDASGLIEYKYALATITVGILYSERQIFIFWGCNDGHSGRISFLKYVKITNIDSAVRLSKHIKMTWNQDSLSKAISA